jgi:hypothetical protein
MGESGQDEAFGDYDIARLNEDIGGNVAQGY